jgi:hypothetical protein
MRWRLGGLAGGLGALVLACPAPPTVPPSPSGAAPTAHEKPCAGLAGGECSRATGLVQAASSFGNVEHEFLIDPASALATGRGAQRTADGTYSMLPTRCAAPSAEHTAKVDASTIDFSFVGVTVDRHLVSADTNLGPYLSAGGEHAKHRVSLVAIAFVRDLDPQFFSASPDVTFEGNACACGRATHFIGAVKVGGMLSYEMEATAAEVRGRALDFIKGKLATADARITQTTIGGLEVEGLDGAERPETAGKRLAFRVKNPVPLAYAVYPLADVCKLAFPEPEVTPKRLDFATVPYGQEQTRLVHVVNRASFELSAVVGRRMFSVPARGTADLPVTWEPFGEVTGCEDQAREEVVELFPTDPDAPVTPRAHSTKLELRVRTGKPVVSRSEHVDSGEGYKPRYETTKREWACPPDYQVDRCHIDRAICGDGPCRSQGYAAVAEPTPTGCRFSCSGPTGVIPGLSSHFCKFDATMDCRLRCK